MKIFIDSADTNEIKQVYEWGIADGVTTNPSLIKKAVKKHSASNLKGYVSGLLKLAKGTPVSLEVTETSAEGMIEEGLRLFKLFNKVAKNVVIKIPINPSQSADDDTQFAGIAAIKALKAKNVPVNCTLVFTPEQALLAAKAGADYISPFAGRVDDFIRSNDNEKFSKTDYFSAEGKYGPDGISDDNGIVSGIDLVAKCVEIVEHYELKSHILAASLRNTRQVREAALVGAHVATLPFSVVKDMLKHDKTYEGMKKFMDDVVPEYRLMHLKNKPNKKRELGKGIGFSIGWKK